MIAARLRSIDICDLHAAGWRHTGDVYRHPDHGIMWPAWDGWRGVGRDGRKVGPCGTAMEVVELLTAEGGVMRHVVMFSGGIGSWAAAKRVAARHGTDDLTLLFTDTLCEDEDTYRFLREAAENVGGELVWLKDGRTIWDVFKDVGFLGNSRVDPCSRILKRELADRWLSEHCDPADTVVYVGIDWTEEHRFIRLRERKKPWRYEAPLCEPPYLTKDQLHQWAEREGLRMQRLYRLGMPHANCGGGCVKMGQGGFARLLMVDRERFLEWERHEQEMRDLLGDVAILRDRTGGTTKPLTLRELRERIEGGGQCDLFDIGGCGCFVDVDDEEVRKEAA